MSREFDSRNFTKKIALLALLTAMGVVLARFVPVLNILTSKYEFSFVAVMAAAYLTGPVGGAVVGGLIDLIGALLVPTGGFFPGFTVTAVLTGIIYGLLFYKKITFPKILLAVILTQAFCSLLINTFFIWKFFVHGSFTALLATRAIQAVIMAVMQIIFAEIFFRKIDFKKYIKFTS